MSAEVVLYGCALRHYCICVLSHACDARSGGGGSGDAEELEASLHTYMHTYIHTYIHTEEVVAMLRSYKLAL